MSEGLPLSIRDLEVRGDGGRTILSVPVLDVAPGTALGIRGPSGAGKSTLLMALAGLVPAGGSVRWGGEDLCRLKEPRRAAFRRRQVGLVFQDALLFDELDAAGNAAILSLFSPAAGRAEHGSRAADGLRRLGLPEGRRPVASFSGGERQRVAVARALAQDPPILLADEPTAALDAAAGAALTRALCAEATERGRTLVVASHDARLLAAMDEVVTLEAGRMREEA